MLVFHHQFFGFSFYGISSCNRRILVGCMDSQDSSITFRQYLYRRDGCMGTMLRSKFMEITSDDMPHYRNNIDDCDICCATAFGNILHKCYISEHCANCHRDVASLSDKYQKSENRMRKNAFIFQHFVVCHVPNQPHGDTDHRQKLFRTIQADRGKRLFHILVSCHNCLIYFIHRH